MQRQAVQAAQTRNQLLSAWLRFEDSTPVGEWLYVAGNQLSIDLDRLFFVCHRTGPTRGEAVKEEVSLLTVCEHVVRSSDRRMSPNKLNLLRPWSTPSTLAAFLVAFTITVAGLVANLQTYGPAQCVTRYSKPEVLAVLVIAVPLMWWEAYVLACFINVAVHEKLRLKRIMYGFQCLLMTPGYCKEGSGSCSASSTTTCQQTGAIALKPEWKYFIDLTAGENAVVLFEIRRVLLDFGRVFQTRTAAFCAMILALLFALVGWLGYTVFQQLGDADEAVVGEAEQQYRRQRTLHLGILCSIFSVVMLSALSVLIMIGDQVSCGAIARAVSWYAAVRVGMSSYVVWFVAWFGFGQVNWSVHTLIGKVQAIELGLCRTMESSASSACSSACSSASGSASGSACSSEARRAATLQTITVLRSLTRSLESEDRVGYVKVRGVRGWYTHSTTRISLHLPIRIREGARRARVYSFYY
jgi:hypothetical protein